jgi:hypothetical protein
MPDGVRPHGNPFDAGRAHVAWRLRVGILLLLAGCTSSLNCTLIGCDSGVSVDLRAMTFPPSTGPVTAILCVDGACQDVQISAPGQALLRVSVDLPRPPATVTVSMEMFGAGGAVLAPTAPPGAPVRRLTPNGEKCGPVCNVVTLRYDSASRSLVPVN